MAQRATTALIQPASQTLSVVVKILVNSALKARLLRSCTIDSNFLSSPAAHLPSGALSPVLFRLGSRFIDQSDHVDSFT
jgi:hypothetical protein